MGKLSRPAVLPVLLWVSLLFLPAWLSAQEQSADAFSQRGILCIRNQQWGKAVNEFNEALKLDPKHVKSYLGRGVAYVFSNQPDRAIADFNRVLQLQPRGPESFGAYLNRGVAYRDKKQYDLALKDFKQAIALKPNDPLAVFYKASALDLSGRQAEALVALKEFVRMCPEREATLPLLNQAKARIKMLEGQSKASKPPGGE